MWPGFLACRSWSLAELATKCCLAVLSCRTLNCCLCSPVACRGLEAMLHQRRKLLQYLRRTSFDKYAVLISRIGLKDSYGPQVGAAGGRLACVLRACCVAAALRGGCSGADCCVMAAALICGHACHLQVSMQASDWQVCSRLVAVLGSTLPETLSGHYQAPAACMRSSCLAATAASSIVLQDRFSSRYKGVLKGRPAASSAAAKPAA